MVGGRHIKAHPGFMRALLSKHSIELLIAFQSAINWTLMSLKNKPIVYRHPLTPECFSLFSPASKELEMFSATKQALHKLAAETRTAGLGFGVWDMG